MSRVAGPAENQSWSRSVCEGKFGARIQVVAKKNTRFVFVSARVCECTCVCECVFVSNGACVFECMCVCASVYVCACAFC